MRIEVTAEDIAKGQREEACACPIALALRRAGFEDAAVRGADYYDDELNQWALYGADGEFEALLPRACGDFARDFDKGKPVEPFAFDLDVEPPQTPELRSPKEGM